MTEAPRPVVDQGWVTSSYSTGSGECVQVRHQPDVVGVRDSKNVAGPVLGFGPASWASLVKWTSHRD